MNILVVSQYAEPENVPIAAAVPRELAARGHRVRLLTGYPNYPSGKLFDGYQQRWRTHTVAHGVEVLRVPLFADHSASARRRFLNYTSFGVSATTARAFSRGADVVYVYATQMTPALGPWLWRLTGGAPYVLHVQDLWPDSLVGSSLLPEKFGERSLLAILNVWLSNVYKHAAALIAIAPRMVQTLVARGVDSHKVHLVYNWAERPTLSPGSSIERSRSGEGTKILYAGNVGDMQDLGTAIEAAFRARDAGVCLTIVGDGVALPRMRKLVNELGADNITFRDPVPSSKMGSFYESADYALVSLKDLATFRGAIPSKFQAALAYGVPIISTVQGDTRDLVEYYNVGLTTDAEDVFGLERAFREAAGWPNEKWMSAHRNAIEAFTSDFSPSIGISKIESILAEIAFPVRENASRETDKKRSRE